MILAMTHPAPGQRPTAPEVLCSGLLNKAAHGLRPDPARSIWLCDLFQAFEVDGFGSVTSCRVKCIGARVGVALDVLEGGVEKAEFVGVMDAQLPRDADGFATIVTAMNAILRQELYQRFSEQSDDFS